MATMVHNSQRESPPTGSRQKQDRTPSVREVCLLGTAPGEPGASWMRPPRRIALHGREYQVIAAQKASDGGYLHLSPVETGVATTDR